MGLGTCSMFLLKDYFRVGPWFKNWETKPVHSAQDMWWLAHIRLEEREHGNHFSKPSGVGNHNHIKYQTWIIHYPNFPSNFISYIVCQVCCCDGARIILLFLFLFAVCRAPNRAPMRVFFLRFVGHQIVFYFVVPGLVCLLGLLLAGFYAMFTIINLSSGYWLLVVGLTELEDCYLYFELISSCTKITKWC